jgi:Flp pilus assembly protein TadG
MAVAATMLVTMLIGMIGTAQFIMLHQIVSNASRAAARHAVRSSTTSDTQVRNTVQDYMERCLPSVSDNVISNALTVNVLDGNAAAMTGTSLGSFTSGNELAVEVQFTFDAVRWLPTVLEGRTIEATTTMRRD